MLDQALNSLRSTKQILNVKGKYFKERNVWLNKHVISLHEKLALGFACVILFFVGAPLGALIRKGGIGLPMIIAILLFLTYHFIGIFAKNSAKDGTFSPIIAAWFSTIIVLPLGYFLTKRATADRGIFEFDHIIEPIKKFLKIDNKSEITKVKPTTSIALSQEKELEAKSLLIDYNMHSKFSYVFYCISVILFILYFVLRNNKLEELAAVFIQISAISGGIYMFYFILSTLHVLALSKLTETFHISKNPFLTILGFIVYPVSHFLLKIKINKVFS